jgi:hypothetical protein
MINILREFNVVADYLSKQALGELEGGIQKIVSASISPTF